MKALAIYLAGVVTPFILLVLAHARWCTHEWMADRRYQRAWDKFSRQFDRLSDAQLQFFKKHWVDNPEKYERYCDDRTRYFEMRWMDGRTTEI